MKALAIAAAILASGPALADCMGSERMRQNLQAKYGETIVAVGQRSDGILIEVWRSPDNGSWTVLETDSSRGLSCILHFGEGMALASEMGAPA